MPRGLFLGLDAPTEELFLACGSRPSLLVGEPSLKLVVYEASQARDLLALRSLPLDRRRFAVKLSIEGVGWIGELAQVVDRALPSQARVLHMFRSNVAPVLRHAVRVAR